MYLVTKLKQTKSVIAIYFTFTLVINDPLMPTFLLSSAQTCKIRHAVNNKLIERH